MLWLLVPDSTAKGQLFWYWAVIMNKGLIGLLIVAGRKKCMVFRFEEDFIWISLRPWYFCRWRWNVVRWFRHLSIRLFDRRKYLACFRIRNDFFYHQVFVWQPNLGQVMLLAKWLPLQCANSSDIRHPSLGWSWPHLKQRGLDQHKCGCVQNDNSWNTVL